MSTVDHDAIRRVTEPLLRLAELSGSGVVVVDLDGVIVAASGRAEDAITDTVHGLTGRTVAEFIGTIGAGPLESAIAEVVATGAARAVTFGFRGDTGQRRTVSVEVGPVFDGGRVVAVAIMRQRPTDPEADVRYLERQLSQYVALASAASEVMWRCDYVPTFHYTYLNPAGEAVLGVTLDELAADPDLPVARVHPDDRASLLAARDDPATVTWPMVHRWADGQGSWIRLEVREIPIVAPDGRLVATLGIAHNLTARDRESQVLLDALAREQQAVDRLRAVDELRQTFLRAVSHELRTPLASVLGYAETLQEHHHRLPKDRVDQLTERLVNNAVRLRTLLDDLLDIDRLERGTLTADLRLTDVSLPVLRAVELVGSPLGQIRVEVQQVMGRVDAPKLERIVDNLVHNALKHAGPAATVWVRLFEEQDHLVLVIEDDGPGIPADLRERLFEPFEQGPRSAGLPSPGTGIGLTLVRRFVELHHGTITIEDGDHGGARFVVRIPTATEQRWVG